MEFLAKYDPYSIEQIEFFVQKKSKYTTFKSVFATLIILILAVFLNISSIQHLWIPRMYLPTVQTSRKMSYQRFSSNYICIMPKTIQDTMPETALININVLTNQILRNFSKTQKFNNNHQINKVSNGRKKDCYDFEGAYITNRVYLKFLISSTNETKFDVIFKTYSKGEILGNGENNYFYFQGPLHFLEPSAFNFHIKKIGGIYYDKLLIDYEPEKIHGLSPVMVPSIDILSDKSQINLYSEVYSPFDLTDQYIMIRHSIAQILGHILSWFSVFALMFAFGMAPIIDFHYKLELAKRLYDNQKLNKIDLSLLSYFKYLISNLRKKLFDEDIIQKAFDQLQKNFDLLNLIKKQILMKKLLKQNQTLNLSHKYTYNLANQPNSDMSEVLISKDIILDEKLSEKSPFAYQGLEMNIKGNCEIITDPDQQSRESWYVRLIKAFDISEIEISLIANKGQGYKTGWNAIIATVCLCLLLWFAFFAGLFKLNPIYDIQTLAVLNDESIYPNKTLNPEDIIFRLQIESPLYELSVVLVDQFDSVVQHLSLLNGSDCDSYVQALNETVEDGWMCLSKSITISNSGLNKVKLGFRLEYGEIQLTTTNILIKIAQYDLVGNQIKMNLLSIRKYYASDMIYSYSSQIIIVDQNSSETPSYYWTVNNYLLSSQTIFKGISLCLNDEFIRVKNTSSSLWDAINNAWSIFVVAFSVFLSKFTRYLNLRQREKIIRSEQNQNRNDIISIISTQQKIISKVFPQQMSEVKYFYKTNLTDFQLKSV